MSSFYSLSNPETCALIRKLSNSFKAKIYNFFTNGVSGEVVGGILFSLDELFWME
jgi:hypothetical protein